MKSLRPLVFLLAAGLLLPGCLPAAGPGPQQTDMQELKLRLAELEQGLAAVRMTGSPESDITRRVADLQSALDALRVDQQSLQGRVDEVTRDNTRLREELALLRDDLDMKTGSLEKRLSSAPVPAPTSPAPTPATAKKSPAPPSVVKAPMADSPEAQYEAALNKIQQGKDFAGGLADMRAFLASHSAHPLAVNAMYWSGEALYGMKKYEDAILQLQDVIAQYPDHPKAAAALLKQGMAFDALGDRASGRATLKKLMDRFPLSPEAERAKALQKEWK